MPKCCVKGCGMKYSNKTLRISLHKLPKNESFREKWLESLGQENIDYTQKLLYVCSLHFEEHCINRTLDIVRLQENAVPTRFPLEFVKQGQVALSTVTSNIQQNTSEIANQEEITIKTISAAAMEVDVGNTSSMTNFEQTLPGTSTLASTDYITVQRLKEKCSQQRKKIKRLNEKCRRQAKKLAEFSNTIQDLKNKKFMNNEGNIMLEECSGPKDFLKRQVTKSRGLPLERKYWLNGTNGKDPQIRGNFAFPITSSV